jgi:glycosyltransferase involved in cell wall biosynthesis
MGKNGKKKAGQYIPPPPPKKIQPFVSICTPTFNRRPFIQTMFACFKNQTYPKSRMEWIIIDDGTDKIQDLIDSANIPQIKYFPIEGKMTLGAKRNLMHEKTRGSIIVYMDDDDYYPPDRVEHAVERLRENPKALCAGSSELYVYFKHIQKMYQCGPYGPNHATAGTFAFKRELLDQTKYDETASLAEEKSFLKNYTIPFVQLDPMKSILVFSHEHNTFDKRKLLENPHPQYMKESPKKVRDFIRFPKEEPIHEFFMNQIDGLLLKYEPGEPKMKPDVLKQIEEITKERAKLEAEARAKHYQQMMQQQQQQNNGLPPIPGQQQPPMNGFPGMPQIMVNEPGKEPRPLGPEEIIQLIQTQQQQLQQMQQLLQEQQGKNTNIPQIMSNQPGEAPRAMTVEEILQLINGQQSQIQGLHSKIAILEGELQSTKLRLLSTNMNNPKENIVLTFDPSEEVDKAPLVIA